MRNYPIPLLPVSMRTIKQDSMEWTVSQKFERLGVPVTITAWGYSRKVALHRFAVEIWEEGNRDYQDDFQELYNLLWNIAGLFDKIIEKIRSLK